MHVDDAERRPQPVIARVLGTACMVRGAERVHRLGLGTGAGAPGRLPGLRTGGVARPHALAVTGLGPEDVVIALHMHLPLHAREVDPPV